MRTQVRPWDSAGALLPVSAPGIVLPRLFTMLPRSAFLKWTVERGAPRRSRPSPVTPGALCSQRLDMLYSGRSAALPAAASAHLVRGSVAKYFTCILHATHTLNSA
ncbi:hypothetical protein NDU88_003188 [Pleurodeles waltl]|uniref:Uncharacterized protein n=1 Tax=Pleurodeles waltl TaxID=8319 RepID=A0AAV7W1F3_PLEWA|nr:hypothetical protein NDU88_003188 [Pleurodeles waltl]